MLKHKIDHLKNGLTVISIPMESVRSVTVMTLANTGSRYERPEQYGIAHFFEHMVFKGTKNYPDAQALALTVDKIGADFNAFTSKEYTGYYVQAASEHFQTAVDVVSDMLLTPKLRQEDIDREKGVIIEEINMYVDSPARHIANIYDRMVYQGTGLGHDILGKKETVNSFTSQDFKDFLNQWYGLSNLVLVVSGDSKVVGQKNTLEMIEKMFSKDAGNRAEGKVDNTSFLADKSQTIISSERLHVEKRATEQAHFVMGWPGISRIDDRRFAMTLLSMIMGGYMSSRLFTELREKRGLCYYISAGSDQFHDGGMFEVSAGVDPKRVYQALELVIKEFEQVLDQSKKITQSELQTAKDHIAGKMALSLEDSQSVAQYFGVKQLLMGEIESPTEVIEKIKAVKLDELVSLATELIKDKKVRLAIIGNFDDQDKFLEIIQ